MRVRRALFGTIALLLGLFVSVTAVAGVASAGTASAARHHGCPRHHHGYPAGHHCTIFENKSTVNQGGSFTAGVTGYYPGEGITWVGHSVAITFTSSVAGSGGGSTVTINVPRNFPIGRHTLTAEGNEGDTLSESFNVDAFGTGAGSGGKGSGGSGSLPFTGLEIGLGSAGIAVAAIGVGALFVAAGRRRRSSPA